MIPKSPRVMILIGIVRSPSTGLTMRLISPSTSPARSATVIDATEIPGIKRSARTTVADSTSHFKTSFKINIGSIPLSLQERG